MAFTHEELGKAIGNTLAGGDDWSSIVNMLGYGMWIGLGGLAVLTLTARAVSPAR